MMRKAWLGIFLAVVAQAAMVPKRVVSLQQVAEYWKHQFVNARLSEDQARVALLARVAVDTEAAESVQIDYTGSEIDGIKAVDTGAVVSAMEAGLSHKEWTSLPSRRRGRIKKNRVALKEALGEKSYLWAWCEFQLGERAAAKAILLPLYAAEADRVMQLKTADYVFGATPLDSAERYLSALRALSEPAEISGYEEQLRKMKAHLSNLPQTRVMT